MSRKNYILTEKAEQDLKEAKIWSLQRWNKELTNKYFEDLHQGAQFIAEHFHSYKARDDLSGASGLFVYPVREHYIVYLPIENKCVVIVSVIRQSRDIQSILKKWNFRIQSEIEFIKKKISCGEIILPNNDD